MKELFPYSVAVGNTEINHYILVMKSISLQVAISLLLICRTSAIADQLLVPQEYSTIQSGLTAASAGDTVLVAAGSYSENLHFPAVAVTLLSASGAAVTIIDGNNDSHTVLFDRGETVATLLQGFTICNGNAPLQESKFGGGIYCDRASPTIRDNLIIDNQALLGGGICCFQSTAVIMDNTISANSAVRGAGIYAYESQPIITGNRFRSNQCEGNGGGGAIALEFCNAVVERNFIHDNGALTGGGMLCRFDSSEVSSNTVTGNDALAGAGLLCRFSAPLFQQNILSHNLNTGQGVATRMCIPRFGCNDIWGNSGGDDWEGENLGGNFSADPLFCDLGGEDFRLQPGSPCWPGSECGLIGASDVDCDGQGVSVRSFPEPLLPQSILLFQNYPNPFNPTTTIEFVLPRPQEIRLSVYNLLGQQVAVLAEGIFTAGLHRILFDTNAGAARCNCLDSGSLPGGVYIYRLTSGSQAVSMKMVLVK